MVQGPSNTYLWSGYRSLYGKGLWEGDGPLPRRLFMKGTERESTHQKDFKGKK